MSRLAAGKPMGLSALREAKRELKTVRTGRRAIGWRHLPGKWWPGAGEPESDQAESEGPI